MSKNSIMPNRDHFLLYLRLVALLSAQFVLSYGLANWWSSQHPPEQLYRLYFPEELQIPFVPAMIWVYLSIQILFLLPLFFLDRRGLIALARAMAVVMAVAVGIFIALPTQLGFDRVIPDGMHAMPYRVVFALDAPHNLFPSLHVALSSLTVAACLAGRSPVWVAVLGMWWLALLASVIVVHQHHVPDIVAGLALAAAGWWWIYRPRQALRMT